MSQKNIVLPYNFGSLSCSGEPCVVKIHQTENITDHSNGTLSEDEERLLQDEWESFLQDVPHCVQFLRGGFLDENFPNHRKVFQDSQVDDENLIVEVDVSGFKPEDLAVKTTGKTLSVQARREEKDELEGTYVCKEFQRDFALGGEVDPESVSSILTAKNKLKIFGPVSDCSKTDEDVVYATYFSDGEDATLDDVDSDLSEASVVER